MCRHLSALKWLLERPRVTSQLIFTGRIDLLFHAQKEEKLPLVCDVCDIEQTLDSLVHQAATTQAQKKISAYSLAHDMAAQRIWFVSKRF